MSELLETLIRDARIWRGHEQVRHSQPEQPTGYQALDRELGNTGWPRGALTECLLDHYGIGELQLFLPLMQALSRRGQAIFWLNPPQLPYAPALAREGIALDRVILARTQDTGDFLWTLENCLRSPVTGLVMAWPGRLASRDIRRLQLAAEAGTNVGVLFRERRYSEHNSPAALRLELEADEHQQLKVSVLKRRGGWPGQHCSLAMTHRSGGHIPDTSTIVQGPWAAPSR